tara:strand:- start:185 stop:358 length:174 start_codon:yes stop_codon:yes gene_type:complete
VDDFNVALESQDAKLFVLLTYLTAGNWDVDEVATAVEYIKLTENESRAKAPVASLVK